MQLPTSPELYYTALEIKNTLYPYLRTVSMTDTLMPDDYNIPYQIIKSLLSSVGQPITIPDRTIKIGDDVYAQHVLELREMCYKLWMYIYNNLHDPYTDDPDFYNLRDILEHMRVPSGFSELRPDEWNAISNYCKGMVDLILRYFPYEPV